MGDRDFKEPIMIKTITTGVLLAAAALVVTPTANADPDRNRSGPH
jgi:hypothetical protein